MVTTPPRLALLAGALALGAAGLARAADAPAAPVLVSGATAAMLADTCAGCHGTDGNSAGPAAPSLAGMSAEYFTEQMEGFRDGKVYSTIMGRISKGFSEDEVKLMAEFFNGRPYVVAVQTFDEGLVAKGKKLHDKYCEKCHTEGGRIVKPEAGDDEEEYHILAGQWTPYLEYAMEDFRAERREMPKKMKTKLDDLLGKAGDAGLTAINAYYASEKSGYAEATAGEHDSEK